MSRKSTLRSIPGGAGAKKKDLEWIGGRLPTSIGIQHEGQTFYAELVLWAEVQTGVILGTELAEPGGNEQALCSLFRTVLDEPAVGPPRVPQRIRVRTNADAVLVAAALPPGVALSIDAVPELDAILADFEQVMASGKDDASYFDDDVSEAALAALFVAAGELYRAAPWKTGYDCDLLRIDVPELEEDGLCVSILGAEGDVFGFSLFDSVEDYEAFVEASCEIAEGVVPSGPRDFGCGWRLLSFDRGADLPKKMRREVRDHAWPTAGAKAFPTFSVHDRRGMPQPVTDRDLVLLSVCAAAIAVFMGQYPHAFKDLDEDTLPDDGIVLELVGQGLPSCTVTFPYDPAFWAAAGYGAEDLDEPDDPDRTTAEFVRLYKIEHYATWPDVALPALGGRTPRKACRSKAGRRAVEELLRDIELHEQTLPEETRYDFGILRRELGL